MKRYQAFTLIGGILLMLGAALPWATLSTSFLGLSRSITGLEGDGILTAAGGLILVIIALAAKGEPDRIYSVPAILIALLCGILLASKVIALSGITTDPSISTSLGLGLSCVSPLGVLFGLIGGATRIPAVDAPVETAAVRIIESAPQDKAPVALPPEPAPVVTETPPPAAPPVETSPTVAAPSVSQPAVVARPPLKPIKLPGPRKSIFTSSKIPRIAYVVFFSLIGLGALIFGGIFLASKIFIAPTPAPTIDFVAIQLTAIAQVYAAKTQTALAIPSATALPTSTYTPMPTDTPLPTATQAAAIIPQPTVTYFFSVLPTQQVVNQNSINPVSPSSGSGSCCKTCGSNSQPCGDACISLSYTCHKAPGCACK